MVPVRPVGMSVTDVRGQATTHSGIPARRGIQQHARVCMSPTPRRESSFPPRRSPAPYSPAPRGRVRATYVPIAIG